MIYLDERRTEYIQTLTEYLPLLRARIRISQEDLARGVGISRQTYSLIETGKQNMTWVTFMAIIAFFANNEKTRKELQRLGLID
ncbi:MAG: helix-turn-helix domain-containing protein [Clostridia bacterium]|nr:helix-turn-helix domain-containing protein [Clostridia bacterium]